MMNRKTIVKSKLSTLLQFMMYTFTFVHITCLASSVG